ncbi:IS110 family transposase, partial [Actinomycetospora sp. C-140]
MPMLAETVDAVVGADTHRDTHSLEILTAVGATVAATTVSNTADGHQQACAWIAEHAPGARVVAGVEGTRSYGAGLTRALHQAGLAVCEIEQPSRRERRRGKSDTRDAHLAARQVLALHSDALPTPRADGDREALRILLGAREEMRVAKTQAVNRLRALLLTGDDSDRALNPRGRFTIAAFDDIAGRRPARTETREQAVRRVEAQRLAHQARDLDRELRANNAALLEIARDLAPALLAHHGVGPVSAAQAIVSWSHHGRCRNDAAFASLAGVSPLDASSGRQQRHRLNRGGDRALNRALHAIVHTRWSTCPRTRAYIDKRRAQQRTDPEIRRSLKRYVAR